MNALPGILIVTALLGPQQAPKSLEKQIALVIEHNRTDQLWGILKQLPSVSEAGLVPDLWMLFDHLVQSGDQNRAISLAEEICRLGNREDLEDLLRRRQELPTGPDQQRLLLALCQCRIRQQMQELDPQATASAAGLGEVVRFPEYLAGAGAELHDAFERYQAHNLTYKEILSPDRTSGIALPPNWHLFFASVESLLLQQEGITWKQILPYYRQGCMVSSLFNDLKHSALLLSLLEENEHRLALSVMMQLLPEERVATREPWERLSWYQQLARWAGEDGQQLLWGGLLNGRSHFLTYLSGGGSAEFAAGLLKIAPVVDRMPLDWMRTSFMKVAARWIRPADSLRGKAGSAAVDNLAPWPPLPAQAASEQVQAGLLEWMNRWIEQDDAAKEVLATGTRILSRLLRHESLPALRSAYAAPYSEIREMARSALQAMGEENLDLPRLAPFRFRFTVDGKPLASTQVIFEVPGIGGQFGTDEEGVLSIDHDTLYPSKEILFRSNPITAPESSWFSVRSAIPATSEIQELAIATITLRIRFSGEAATTGRLGRKVRVKMAQEKDAAYHPVIQWDSLLEGDLKFRLTPGAYRQLQVQVSGAALWTLDHLEIPPQGTQVDVLLDPGADLRFNIRAPGRPAEYQRAFCYQLFRNGRPLGIYWVAEHQPRSHDGLPVGAYLLRVLSSREEQQRFKKGAEFFHSGKEIRFEVRQDGSSEIDLGIIELASEFGHQRPKT